ncbi:ThiF family adenylyltransferase [Longimicrobium terrae]|uniref:THIF-type NAD/FAD binding fold domain-containing protein n=1 Tax=Longimicrobium terrae TaxID=1639882 RepID=A0A841H214_9BACT|nr:ThiF family adenylyltransferase [Longimicrobium terrae]MBB4637522.1 hypothetical protein [Longimicrobium terrae]MBB6071919.1 hypothetical protein [Longimicrobium terrae]NNC30466.1 hypothetical protein [Longimicrobium terrae]
MVPACIVGGRVLTADAFYAERDQRTALGGAYAAPQLAVAVVLAPDLMETAAGQTALLWSLSMLKRMGRAFSRSIIVATSGAADTRNHAALHRSLATLGQAVNAELMGADPFGSIEWRALGDDGALAGVDLVLRIGFVDPAGTAPRLGEVRVGWNGWVFGVDWTPPASWALANHMRPAGEAAETGPAATAAVVAAAAAAVALVYRTVRDEHPSEGENLRYWCSVDTGRVCVDPADASVWMRQGSSHPGPAPWDAEAGPQVNLGELVLVSAGGIGGNAAQVLAASWITCASATVVEPDIIELSNLNRLIRVGVGAVGQPKAAPAVTALAEAGLRTRGYAARYEDLAAADLAPTSAEPRRLLVGVDQVASRLQVQADWPDLLVNAGTSGTSWTVSLHPRGSGACLGCIHGAATQTYAASRRALACGAGMPVVGEEQMTQPEASFPFASVMAAAFQVAALIRTAGAGPHVRFTADARVANSVRLPFLSTGPREREPHCLLLCSHPALAALWAEAVGGSGAAHPSAHAE